MFQKIITAIPFLIDGLWVTLLVSGIVAVASLVVGVIGGIGLVYGGKAIAWPIRLYSDLVRGIPLLVLIFFVYYGFPAIGLDFGSFWAAIVALTLFKAAQIVELVRGAVQSIARGQDEAGKAIGLRFGQRLAYVILPQALRRFLPPWVNVLTDTVKASALVSLVGVVDLMLAVQQVIGRTYEPMPLYLLGAAIYIAINFSLSSLSRTLEARLARSGT